MRLNEEIEGAELKLKWLINELIRLQQEKKQLNLDIATAKTRIQYLKDTLKGARKNEQNESGS